MSSEAGGQLDELKLEDEVQPASDQGSQGGDSDPETSDDELVALVSRHLVKRYCTVRIRILY
jgi:hypothetical protein